MREYNVCHAVLRECLCQWNLLRNVGARKMDVSGAEALYNKGVMMPLQASVTGLLLSIHLAIETYVPYFLGCKRSRFDIQLCLWEMKLVSSLCCC